MRVDRLPHNPGRIYFVDIMALQNQLKLTTLNNKNGVCKMDSRGKGQQKVNPPISSFGFLGALHIEVFSFLTSVRRDTSKPSLLKSTRHRSRNLLISSSRSSNYMELRRERIGKRYHMSDLLKVVVSVPLTLF
jgi:hypothetical protein